MSLESFFRIPRTLASRVTPALVGTCALAALGLDAHAQISYGVGQAQVDGTQQFLVQGAGGSPLPLTTRLLDKGTGPLNGPFLLGGPPQTPLFVGAQVQGFFGSPMSGCTYNVFGEVQNSLIYSLQGSASSIAFGITSVSEHVIDLQVFAQPHEGPRSAVTVSSQQDAGRAVLFYAPFQLSTPRTLEFRASVERAEEAITFGGEVDGETRLGWAIYADVGADGVFDGPSSRLFGGQGFGTCDQAQNPSAPPTTYGLPAGAYFLRLAWLQGSKVEDAVVCPQAGGTSYADSDARVTETGCFTMTAL